MTGWEYDSSDQVTKMRYPGGANGESGESVTYSYHPQQTANRVVGDQTYVEASDYDAAGRLTRRVYNPSNSFQSSYTYYQWWERGGHGRLRSVVAGTVADGDALQSLTYTYDLAGNVTSITDGTDVYTRTGTNEAQLQLFTYDVLDRLTMARATGGNFGRYGPDAYTYGLDGNLASKAGLAYSYDPQSSTCPNPSLDQAHAAVRVGATSYCYDRNGNMVRRTTDGVTEMLTYDAENRLVAVGPQNGGSGGMAELSPGRAEGGELPGAPPRAPGEQGTTVTETEALREAWGRLPLSFIPNAGQSDGQVRFLVKSLGGTLFFTQREVVLAWPHPAEVRAARAARHDGPAPRATGDLPPAVLRLRYQGANPTPAITGTARLPGVANYLLGSDPAQWRTNVPTYEGLVYQGLYAGIDLRYEGTDGQLKSTYLVAAGADPTQIHWRYLGAAAARVDETSGDLLIGMPAPRGERSGGTVIERAPIAWQEINGQRVPVEVRYAVGANGAVGFELGAYDASQPLVIDPTLSYSSYLSGAGIEDATAISVDSANNAYVTGWTWSTNFPITNSLSANQPQIDAFVSKLDATGSTLLFSTYLGGNRHARAGAIELDVSGQILVAGNTESTTTSLRRPPRTTRAAGAAWTPPAGRPTTPTWSSSPPTVANCCMAATWAGAATTMRPP